MLVFDKDFYSKEKDFEVHWSDLYCTFYKYQIHQGLIRDFRIFKDRFDVTFFVIT